MEKVIISDVIVKKSGTKADGAAWTISTVHLTDGRKGDSFDSFVKGEECYITITPNPKNDKWNPNFKKVPLKDQPQEIKSDSNFEIRKCALEQSVALAVHSAIEVAQITKSFHRFVNLLSGFSDVPQEAPPPPPPPVLPEEEIPQDPF